MIGDLVKRLFNGVIVLLAGLAFFLVPVGGKTPAAHLGAILDTPPARAAGAAFAGAAKRLAGAMVHEVERLRR